MIFEICTEGYVAKSCRCPGKQHPVIEVPCTHETHEGARYVGDQFERKRND